MGMPPTRLSFALVIFVLAPGGHIATIGGQELTEGHVAPLSGRGAGLADMVRNHMERVLPPDTLGLLQGPGGATEAQARLP